MKPTKNFKLSKQSKRLLCTVVDAGKRNELKAIAIQAQLESEKKVVKERSRGGQRGAVAED